MPSLTKLPLIGVAVGLGGVALFVLAAVVLLKSHRVEYDPSCGHTRSCTSGVVRSSSCREFIDREARPFAPLSACAGQWLTVFSDDLSLLQGWMGGCGDRRASGYHFAEAVVQAQRVYREVSGSFTGSLEELETLSEAERFTRFRLGTCGGVETKLASDRYVVAISATGEAGGTECWTADDQRRIRRLSAD